MNKPRQWTVKRKSQSEATIWEGNLFIASVAAAPRDTDPCLIAAAPELLEACIGAERALQCHIGNECLKDHFPLKLEMLQAAIAKAQGGAQ